MNHQFLKIAGVKNINEFYKRFPTEESFFKAFPEALKSAQKGITVPGIVDGMGMGMPGIESTGNMFEELTPINNPFSTQSIVNDLANKSPINTTSSISSISSIGNDVSGLDKVGSQLPGLAGSVIKGNSQIKSQKQKLKEAKQANQLSHNCTHPDCAHHSNIKTSHVSCPILLSSLSPMSDIPSGINSTPVDRKSVV